MTITVSTSSESTVAPVPSATVRWVAITPFVGPAFETKVSIPGGTGLGRVFVRGRDNRVATLSGVVKWDANGESLLSFFGSSTPIYVCNGATSTKVKCLASSPTITEASGALVKFTVTLTEVQ